MRTRCSVLQNVLAICTLLSCDDLLFVLTRPADHQADSLMSKPAILSTTSTKGNLRHCRERMSSTKSCHFSSCQLDPADYQADSLSSQLAIHNTSSTKWYVQACYVTAQAAPVVLPALRVQYVSFHFLSLLFDPADHQADRRMSQPTILSTTSTKRCFQPCWVTALSTKRPTSRAFLDRGIDSWLYAATASAKVACL